MARSLNHSPISCPSCDSMSTVYLGKMRSEIGMIGLSNPGSLYRCNVCSLMFRHPFLSPSELTQQYEMTPSGLWQRQGSPDFRFAVRTILENFSSGRVLDIGCYQGDLLQMLPSRYEKYGVEPSEKARQILGKNRIKLVGRTIDQIEIDKPTFHVITLLDLIEHLPRPYSSLSRARKVLLPGGLLILSTGNTDALPWRLMRLDYWYYFSEHVSFFNSDWFRWASRQLDLKIIIWKRFSHFKGTLSERWRQLVRCLAYMIMKSSKGFSSVQELLAHIYPFNIVSEWSSPPATNLWRDHIFVVMKSKT
jgi:SAM-dependent methyltransferase